MKVFFVSIFVFISIMVNGQTNVFCLATACPQTVQLPVSVDSLYARLTTADGYKSIIWSQTSGPNKAVMGLPIINLTGVLQGVSVMPVSGLVAGTYIFTAVGTSAGGITASTTLSVTVVPAIVVVPPPPPTCPNCLLPLVDPTQVTGVTGYLYKGHWYVQITIKGVRTSYELF